MPRPLLLASLGNPGTTYQHTRHSAGHILLKALVRFARAPALQKDRRWGNGSVSEKNDMAFWSSPEYMNASGRPTAAAWRTFLAQHRPREDPDTPRNDPRGPHLIILHDELQVPLGQFKFKTAAGASARGHNGLRSFLNMPGVRELEFSRVGVGIGPRPVERDPRIVSEFVLANLDRSERGKIEDLAPRVWDKLKELRGKAGDFGEDESGYGAAELRRDQEQHRQEELQRAKELQQEEDLVLGPARDADAIEEYFRPGLAKIRKGSRRRRRP